MTDKRTTELKNAAEKYIRANGEGYFSFLAAALRYAAEQLRQAHDATDADREAAKKLDRMASSKED
jgi:hypothetical protein